MENKELVLYLNEQDFEIDYSRCENKINKNIKLFYDELFHKYQENKYQSILYLGLTDFKETLSESLEYFKSIACFFVNELALTPNIEELRDEVTVEISIEKRNEFLCNAPYLVGMNYLTIDWINHLWFNLHHVYRKMILDFNGSVESFFQSYRSNLHIVGRVFFHLVENKKDEYPFAFLATYTKLNNGKSKHLPLKNALIECKDNQEELLNILSTVNKASLKSEFIEEILESGEIFHPIGLNSNEAYTFLKEVPLYESCGILCRIPNFWKNKHNKLKMSITVGNEIQTKVNKEAVLDFNISLSFGGESFTIEEIQNIMASTDGLAYIKGKWIEVDHDKLEATLRAYEKAKKMIGNDGVSIVDAIKLQLNSDKLLQPSMDDEDIEVNQGEFLKETLLKLRQPTIENEIDYQKDFHATLRNYQKQGFYWLYQMKELGLGACLADDMGLGKTIQVIALLNYYKTKNNENNLLIIPASLIGNWMKELDTFAPSLKYYIIHPSENSDYDKEIDLKKYDLLITTYGMTLRIEWLKDIVWDCMILDEAQAIKNPQTKQTKAIKQIQANFKIALTGTPIENRLSDLWSLFDFLNRGLLGNMTEFKKIKNTIQDKDGYHKLRKVVSPFILRRLKTDKMIIDDLPDKIEMKVYSTLSKKQVALYLSLVEEIKEKLQTETGNKRSGIILSSLIKFKQICNHPDQYLGQTNFDILDSGKFDRLKDICETIREKRERVLIFTQFKEMVEPLQAFLRTIFYHDGLILHGGTNVKKRKEIVHTFQGETYVPFLILSIKAGGVGLNLTKANHVIHFDRWWNPAVENQATDRAFRIGQKKNVVVHKFVTKGTIEEKIDTIIEEKLKLSEDIIPTSQEKWIMDMSNEDIMDLFTFSI